MMPATRREVVIDPEALEIMQAARPSDAEREALVQVLHELATDVSRAYRILFVYPPSYRIDVGRFRIHFRFDDKQVRVGFIGVY
jgi:mRNA-degrading endonuclease RelE of RelBE toxin-antitoxin system